MPESIILVTFSMLCFVILDVILPFSPYERRGRAKKQIGRASRQMLGFLQASSAAAWSSKQQKLIFLL
jgi:hypothetical protein